MVAEPRGREPRTPTTPGAASVPGPASATVSGAALGRPAAPVSGPAYYAAGPPTLWRDVRAVLHPPYTAWHLSYVVLGAMLATRVNWTTLAGTLLAFFLAVGVAAHCLDELKGRPLGTSLPARLLAVASVLALLGAVVIGAAGVARVGAGLVVFMAVGVVLVLGYNLELFAGRFHSDVVFALAWGAFPVLVAAYAEQRALRWSAVVLAAGAALLSGCQRNLSTPARLIRRQAILVEGMVTLSDGSEQAIDASFLVAPLERALRLLSWAVVAVAVAFALARGLH
ncbi:MAG: hypothetical protein ACRDZ6_03195 [Acidimicrobiales bacterium]